MGEKKTYTGHESNIGGKHPQRSGKNGTKKGGQEKNMGPIGKITTAQPLKCMINFQSGDTTPKEED